MIRAEVPFEMLFVCHANLCRSPLAEWLSRRVVDERLGSQADMFAISSAGTHAQAGEQMHPYSEQVLLESGIDTDGFRSRPLTAPMLARCQLVLTATRQQRAHCVALAPAALRRTFTLRQFARLAGAVEPAGLAGLPLALRTPELVRSVADVRGGLQPVSPDEDDVADPVNLPLERFWECARNLDTAIEAIMDVIAPA